MHRSDRSAALVSRSTNLAFQLLAEGKEQVINVDQKTMLTKIMAELGANTPPLFSEIDCGAEGVKFSIKLYLESGNQSNVGVVNGQPFMTKSAAVNNAVMMAFRYLEQNCHIRVLDFSSRVARSFGANNTYALVNEAQDAVQKTLDSFEKALGKCKDFCIELERKQMKAKFNGNFTAEGKIFAELSQFLGTLFKRLSLKALNSRSEMNDIEFERMKHQQRGTEKAQVVASKCYSKTVVFTAKDLLDYVLSYFGFETAKYSNGPDGHGMVEGVVKFKIPYIEQLKYCGKLTIRGNGSTSRISEEDAAFKALLLIEEDFNAKIVDLNHSDRVEAENVQIMLLRMLEQILEVGEGVKVLWEKMGKALEDQREHCTYEGSRVLSIDDGHDQSAAYSFCVDGLVRVQQDSSQYYAGCWELFDRMQKITCKLSVIKIKLNIM